MTLAVFLELVEMKAKTASVLPFLIGLCYSYYFYHHLNLVYLLLFFISMLLFNMFVDIWDNYNDYHRALDQDYQRQTNIIGRENLSIKRVQSLMYSFLVISFLIGLVLAYFVGVPILIMGSFCYAVGLLYSGGPRPLSSLPLGEFFSGFTMGFMISLICVYLNVYPHFTWSLTSLASLALIALPNTLWIANLMLANNLCDKAEDEANRRYTLVHYLGIPWSLRLFIANNCLAFVAIFFQYYFGLAPISVLLTFLLVPFVIKQTSQLYHKQVKSQTFICAVKILAFGSSIHCLTYFLGIIF